MSEYLRLVGKGTFISQVVVERICSDKTGENKGRDESKHVAHTADGGTSRRRL